MKKMPEKNANRLYEIEDITRITEIMEEEIENGVIRKNRSEDALAFILTGAYACDLVDRSSHAIPLTLAADESEAMFRAATAGFMGNLLCGQFSQEEAHMTARKMLSSYLMFWAWNMYYSLRDEEQFTMKMRLKMGSDPITGTPGVTVQQIILRNNADPTLTYTFDAAAAAMDCVNTLSPIAVDDGEDDDEAEDAEEMQENCRIFGMFGCCPAAFRYRIMQELYGAFPARLEAWEKAHADDPDFQEALAG